MSDVTTDRFAAPIDAMIGREGNYSNDPNDSGGPTRYGITEVEARAFGYEGDMRDMPRTLAVTIYRERYVGNPQLDQMLPIDAVLTDHLLDAGVNMGPITVGKFIQRSLNVLNNQGADYPTLRVDGVLGRMTRGAISHFYARRGDDGRLVLRGMFTAQQSVQYVEIAETKPSQEKFEFGWQLNRALGGGSVPLAK